MLSTSRNLVAENPLRNMYNTEYLHAWVAGQHSQPEPAHKWAWEAGGKNMTRELGSVLIQHIFQKRLMMALHWNPHPTSEMFYSGKPPWIPEGTAILADIRVQIASVLLQQGCIKANVFSL